MVVAPVCVASRDKPVAHGYWKDLLNILVLVTCDELWDFDSRPSNVLRTYTPRNSSKPVLNDKLISKEQVGNVRKEKQRQNHRRLLEKLVNDKYRALYTAIARLFAEHLRKDIKLLDQINSLSPHSEDQILALFRDISLAGKWAPTPGGSHDRTTNIVTAICQLLFSLGENTGSNAIGPLPSAAPHPVSTDPENCAIYREYYQHWILTPLREALGCPEPLMSAGKWTDIQYICVPSVCMRRNKTHFMRHDPEGYQLYLAYIQSKKDSLLGISLTPVELVAKTIETHKVWNLAQKEQFPKVARFKQNFAEKQLRTVDVRWKALISRLRDYGGFEDTLAVYGISDSMTSIPEYDQNNVHPIYPSIALSLILASITKPPFDAGFIAFLEHLTLARPQGLEEKDLVDLVNDLLAIEPGGSINLQDVLLSIILPLAKEHQVTNDDMIKRILVLSDRRFDDLAGTLIGPWWLNQTSEIEKENRWRITYDRIERAFQDAGYDVPEIIFWELSGNNSVRQTAEVEIERRGVTLMTGYSSEMVRSLLGDVIQEDWLDMSEDEETEEDEEETSPLDVMKKALDKKSYDGLVVLD